MRWKVGDGRAIQFWTDAWCAEDSLVNLLELDTSSLTEADLKVSDFLTPEKLWDTNKLRNYVPDDIVQRIQGIPIPYTNVADSFCWGYTGSGEFSTKSATWRAHDNISKDHPVWPYNWIWKLDVMPKVKVFLWQLCHRALPSRGTLFRRGIHLDPFCPACNNALEDTDHIFLQCPLAQKVWDMAVAHKWLPSIPFAHPAATLQDGLQSLSHNPHSQLSRIVLILWSIWKSRNALIFRNVVPSPMGTVLRAKRNWAEWKLRTTHSSVPSSTPGSHNLPSQARSSHHIRWKLPYGGFIKINFDGSHSSAGAAAGFVLRNWKGGFIMAGSRFMENAPILVAEATAMRDGISAALQAGYRKIQVEGDNQIVIRAIQKLIHTPWQIASILQDIWNLITSCESISFQHTYREGNMAADWMAKFGCSLRCHYLSTFTSPPCRDFLLLLVEDNLGRTLERRAT